MSSGNSLDCSPEDMSQLHANDAAVKEMEAAGISWVCPGYLLASVRGFFSFQAKMGCHQALSAEGRGPAPSQAVPACTYCPLL